MKVDCVQDRGIVFKIPSFRTIITHTCCFIWVWKSQREERRLWEQMLRGECVHLRKRMQLTHHGGNVDNLVTACESSVPAHFVGAGEWGLKHIWSFSRVNARLHGFENRMALFSNCSTDLVGLGLLIVEASPSRPDTPHSVGLLWTSDQPVAETSTWQHATLTRDGHPCPRWDSNPEAQQGSDRRPTLQTARPLGSAVRPC
jgi:hypothetical protein